MLCIYLQTSFNIVGLSKVIINDVFQNLVPNKHSQFSHIIKYMYYSKTIKIRPKKTDTHDFERLVTIRIAITVYIRNVVIQTSPAYSTTIHQFANA